MTNTLLHRLKLPIGIQTFSEIIEEGYYYVDKSGFAVQMADQGKYYFLSRPRRFGNSFFLDTLKELFAGNRKLFTGLAGQILRSVDGNHALGVTPMNNGQS
jgi:hypothetical protein